MLACHGGNEHSRLVKLRAMYHQAVDLLQSHPGVRQSHRGEVGDLIQVEHARRAAVLFRLVLGNTHQRRLTA